MGRELETDGALRAHYAGQECPCGRSSICVRGSMNVSSPPKAESLSDADRGLLRDSVRDFLSKRWPTEHAVEQSSSADAIAALWRELAGQGLASLGADAAEAGLREIVLVFEELGRASCPAPLLGAVAANLALAGQHSNTVHAMLEDLHQGNAMMAVALGAFDGDPAAGRADIRGDTLSGKAAFVEGAQTATHFLVFTSTPAGAALVAGGAPGLKMQVTPGLAVPPFSELTFVNTPAAPLDIPSETLADIALVARLACAGRALGAARAGIRACRRSRQDTKAIRPVDRPVPGRPAQTRQLPDQPGRRAVNARSGSRGARQRQPRLARVRFVGTRLRGSGAARRCRSRHTGRSAPSAMPRSMKRRGISAACTPISPDSAVRRAHEPSLPISCSVQQHEPPFPPMTWDRLRTPSVKKCATGSPSIGRRNGAPRICASRSKSAAGTRNSPS